MCSSSDSMIWLPMVCTGLNEVIGSWKIMAISLPRMARILLAVGVELGQLDVFVDDRAACLLVLAMKDDAAGDDAARRRHDAQDRLAGHALAAAALAHHAQGRPRTMVKVQPSTARTVPSCRKKYVFRSLTSISVSFGMCSHPQ